MRKAVPPTTLDWADETVAALPELATVPEVMRVLRASQSSLYRLMATGRIRSIRTSGGSRRLIPRSAIAEYLRRLEGAA